ATCSAVVPAFGAPMTKKFGSDTATPKVTGVDLSCYSTIVGRQSPARRDGRLDTVTSPLVSAGFALPSLQDAQVVVSPTDRRPGSWAGAPSAIRVDGLIYLAYRLRRPVGLGRGYRNVVAVSTDGVNFEEVAHVERDQFDAASLERPAL